MSTPTPNPTTNSNGFGFWKVLGVIAVVLLALAMIGPLLKGLFWVALLGLAAYGGWMLWRQQSKKKSSGNGPTFP
ncbi:hypothetical protein AAFP30_00960 [Gordonia sp. CPCC 205515]|uniref:hypothetical protein n=1 Tax=Gordonia sp. CPCC 205515 TaxID=3140791 RepID=UPI003AF3D231